MTAARFTAMFFTLAFGFSISAFAGGEFPMNGKIDNQDSPNVQPITEGLVIVGISNSGVMNLEDSSNPLNGAQGSCGGSALIQNGKVTGSGFCIYTDSDGDQSIVSWTAQALNKSGGNDGVWEFVTGTGKYANASGGGSYSNQPSEDRTTSVNSIIGTLKIN